MTPRPLLAFAALVAVVVVLGRASQPAAPAPPAEQPALPGIGTTTAPVPARQVGPLRATVETQPVGTPAIELQARLATRRRIEREGRRVYLDSMFAQTDSTMVRWDDRPVRTLTIRFVPDSALAEWQAALDDARAGMHAWNNNEAGFSLTETTDSTADITVRWIAMLGEPEQLGLTGLQWGTSGTIGSATMTLALRQNPDSTAVPSSIRRRVAAHEFGHALGLPHSERDSDLMFRSSPVGSPSSRDRATLQLLYVLPPGPIGTP